MTFTSEQVQMIKETWAKPAADPVGSGEAVLLAFFTKFPHHQENFKAFKSKPLNELKVYMLIGNLFFFSIIFLTFSINCATGKLIVPIARRTCGEYHRFGHSMPGPGRLYGTIGIHLECHRRIA